MPTCWEEDDLALGAPTLVDRQETTALIGGALAFQALLGPGLVL